MAVFGVMTSWAVGGAVGGVTGSRSTAAFAAQSTTSAPVSTAGKSNSASAVPEIEVIGDPIIADPKIAAPGASVTVIRVDEVHSTHLQWKDLVRQAPGVFASAQGQNGEESLSIRGFSANQVAIFLDGVPLGTGLGSDAINTVPLAWVDRIVVVRGPQAQQASGAMGGAVYITTRGATGAGSSSGSSVESAAPMGHPKGASGKVRASYGSFSTAELDGDLAFRAADTQVHFSAGVQSTEGDYPVRDGRVGPLFDSELPSRAAIANNQQRSYNANLGARRSFGAIPVGLSGGLKHEARGVPGLIGQSLQHVRQEEDSGVVRADIGRPSLNGQLGWDLSRKTFDDQAGEIDGFSSLYVRDLGALTAVAEGQTQLGPHTTGRLRLRASLEAFQDSGTGVSTRSFTRTTGSPTLGLSHSFWEDRIVVSPSLTVTKASELPAVVGGTLAISAQVADPLTLRASGGNGFRYPTFDELYVKKGFLTGNPALREERTIGFDLGVDFELPQFSNLAEAGVEVTYFRYWTRDLIEYVLISGFQYKAFNFADANTQGFELTARARLWRRLKVSSVVTLQEVLSTDALNTDPTYVPGRPRAYGTQSFEVQVTDQLSVGTAIEWAWERFVNQSNTVELPDRVDWGFSGVYDFTGSFTGALEIKNILDGENFDIRGFPLPGRSWYGSLAYRF